MENFMACRFFLSLLGIPRSVPFWVAVETELEGGERGEEKDGVKVKEGEGS